MSLAATKAAFGGPVHPHLFAHLLKIFILAWMAAGVSTAIFGLLWTCNISARMLKDSPAAPPAS